MSNSNELTERIQPSEASISIPTSSKNTEHTPEDLTKKDVIEEDRTYAKGVLGTAEEASGVEQKVLDVWWNLDNDQFVFDLRETANLARIIDPTKRNFVSVAAKFYDPMGFLSPIIIEFKIFLLRTFLGENWLR